MNKKILIIDDDPDFLEVYKLKLGASGFEVAGEHDPNEARWILRSFLPDLIILDLNMPDVSGFDLMLSLPREIGNKRIPVIIFTGRQVDSDEQEARRLGAEAFFVKGRDEQALMEKVKQILG